MTEPVKLSMEELFDKRASQQMVAEATAFKTVPKGLYRLRATKYEASRNDAGRTTIWFSVDILDPEGKRLAKGSIKASPDEGRSAKGYLDTQSKLYGQLSKALFTAEEQADVTVATLVQTFMTVPVDGFVALSFKGPKDPMTGYPTWNDPQNEAEELEFRKRGYSPTNIIRSVQKIQG